MSNEHFVYCMACRALCRTFVKIRECLEGLFTPYRRSAIISLFNQKGTKERKRKC